MKILIFSDTHLNTSDVVETYYLENPDLVVSAGDFAEDVLELLDIDSSIKILSVRGNCDYYDPDIPEELYFQIENFRFFLIHGHRWSVKESTIKLEKKIENEEIDVIIFGHTHIPILVPVNKEKSAAFLFNPGAMRDKRYGVIEITDGKINFFHKTLGKN